MKEFLLKVLEEKKINNENIKEKCIEILQSIQQKFGYIPKEDLVFLSKKYNIPLSHLYGVATFYNQFKLNRRGKYLIEICDGTACHVAHNEELKRAVKDMLNIDVGETTKDFLFTLQEVRCLGACALAPVCRINNVIYGKLNYEKMKNIIKELIEKEKRKK